MSNLFIPLTKVDAQKRLVYGIATAEKVDRSGETMDYATTKPNYEAWSAELHKATGGLSKGNLRAMHGKTAAGKLTDITFNDDAKQIEICAKVVDDQEWKKVEEGVYTGFSQGGSYVKRWTENGVKKYTAQPSEISLVDLPCLADATFEMVKGEGLSETRHFADAVTVQPPTNADVMAKAAELAKAAGGTDFASYLDPARDALIKAVLPAPAPEATEEHAPPTAEADAVAKAAAIAEGEVEQVWKAKDGATFAKKADALAHNAKAETEAAVAGVAAPALAALEKLGSKLGAPAAEKPASAARLIKVEGADALEKGLSQVSRLASIIQDLAWLQTSVQSEAAREGDGSGIPATIMEQTKALGASLVAMCGEEVGELFTAPAGVSGYYDSMYMAAGKVPDGHVGALAKFGAEHPELAKDAREALEKLGARNSKSDAEKIQAMHDHSVSLGAACAAKKAAEPDGLAKAADDLAKMTVERDRALGLAEGLQKSYGDLTDKVVKLTSIVEAQPTPLHLQGRAITKAQDTAGNDNQSLDGEGLAKVLAALAPEERALVLTKAAQMTPLKMGA